MTRIIDMHGDLQAESSGWMFGSSLAGDGGILWQPHYRLHSLLVINSQVSSYAPTQIDTVNSKVSWHEAFVTILQLEIIAIRQSNLTV